MGEIANKNSQLIQIVGDLNIARIGMGCRDYGSRISDSQYEVALWKA